MNLPPKDWEIIVLDRLFLYNKDTFVSFQQYTILVYKTHEI